jgi:secreted trypsin-like serine protease
MPLYKENNICALNHKQTSNICYGDSGGPLMQYNNNKKWYIYGVSSLALAFQNYSCNPYKPSYFTKISYYLDWIQKNTHKL